MPGLNSQPERFMRIGDLNPSADCPKIIRNCRFARVAGSGQAHYKAARRPSSSGPGRRPFTAETRVRVPLGVPGISIARNGRADICQISVLWTYARSQLWFDNVISVNLAALADRTSPPSAARHTHQAPANQCEPSAAAAWQASGAWPRPVSAALFIASTTASVSNPSAPETNGLARPSMTSTKCAS